MLDEHQNIGAEQPVHSNEGPGEAEPPIIACNPAKLLPSDSMQQTQCIWLGSSRKKRAGKVVNHVKAGPLKWQGGQCVPEVWYARWSQAFRGLQVCSSSPSVSPHQSHL